MHSNGWMGGQRYGAVAGGAATYRGLDVADQHGHKEVAGVVRVADIVESFGGILACLGQEDVFAAGVLVKKLGDVVHLALDHHPAVASGCVLGQLGRSDGLGGIGHGRQGQSAVAGGTVVLEERACGGGGDRRLDGSGLEGATPRE